MKTPSFENNKKFTVGPYSCTSGFATRVELPNGKLVFTGQQSFVEEVAKRNGYPTELVRYQGCCIYMNIADRAIGGFPVWVNGEYVTGQDIFASDEDMAKYGLIFSSQRA